MAALPFALVPFCSPRSRSLIAIGYGQHALRVVWPVAVDEGCGSTAQAQRGVIKSRREHPGEIAACRCGARPLPVLLPAAFSVLTACTRACKTFRPSGSRRRAGRHCKEAPHGEIN
mmetsp:Transcript_48197/g.108552  ORF Transcript_48197/g.108552 Transcript_48197/m.108552 type:complete len:116 (-) Transcript_48197:316-663(-)